jgi:putative MFS transporter
LFLAYFYLPESPRWLISQRKVGEAERVILDIASCNNVIISPFSLSCDSENINIQISESHWKQLISKPMIKVTLPLILIWASFGFTYNGIILFVARVYSNNSSIGSCSFDYSAITINAASELIGTLIATLVIDTWGRNRTQTYIYLVAAISILILSFSSSQYVLLACAFIARSTLMGASNATWVITPELYPTQIRATGHSVCNSMARITAFFVPFLIDSPATNQQICLVLAIVVMIATIASSTLPETKNKLLDKNSNDIVEINEYEYNKL